MCVDPKYRAQVLVSSTPEGFSGVLLEVEEDLELEPGSSQWVAGVALGAGPKEGKRAGVGLSWDWGLRPRAGRGPNDYGQARPRCSIGHIGAEKAPRPGAPAVSLGRRGRWLPDCLGRVRNAGFGPERLKQPSWHYPVSLPNPSPASGEAACPAEGCGARGRAGAP